MESLTLICACSDGVDGGVEGHSVRGDAGEARDDGGRDGAVGVHGHARGEVCDGVLLS